MNPIKKLFDNIHPYVEEGGKFHAFRSLVDGFETFAFVPNTTSRVGSVNIHDAIDSKRIMSLVVIALLPALFFGMYNVGYLLVSASSSRSLNGRTRKSRKASLCRVSSFP